VVLDLVNHLLCMRITLFILLSTQVCLAKSGICLLVGSEILRAEESRGLSYQDVEGVVYKALRPYQSLPAILGNRLPVYLKTSIRREAMTTLMTQDIVSGLKRLGVFRESTNWEKVNRWFRDRPITSDVLETTAWNAFSLHYFHALIHLPKVEPFRARMRRPEVLQRIRERGFDSVYEEMRQEFGGSERFELAWRAGRHAYFNYLTLLLIKMAAENQDEILLTLDPRNWFFAYSWTQTTNDDLRRRQEEDFKKKGAGDKIRVEQFTFFREAYAETGEKGPPGETFPSPWEPDFHERLKRFPASYQEEALSTWENLTSTPDVELKAEFPEDEN